MMMMPLINRMIRLPSLCLSTSLYVLLPPVTFPSSSLLLTSPHSYSSLVQLIQLTKTSTSPALNSPSFKALSTRSACFLASKDLRIFSTSRMDSLRVFWE